MRTKNTLRFYKRKGKSDGTHNGYAHAEPSKGFYEPLGNLYFKTNSAVFTGGDAMACGINMLVIMFLNDKNTRKNNCEYEPSGS